MFSFTKTNPAIFFFLFRYIYQFQAILVSDKRHNYTHLEEEYLT